MIRFETVVGQPSGPVTGLAQVYSKDAPSQAFTREQRVAIGV